MSSFIPPAPFRAAPVNRLTNEEIPYAVATFDGRTLRLQMRAEKLIRAKP